MPKTMQADYLGLTEEQFRRFHRACHATFGVLACDINGASMPRAHVIEITLDADYMRNYGERRTPLRKSAEMPWLEFYDTVLDPWIRQNYDSQEFNKLMKTVFPFSRYDTR